MGDDNDKSHRDGDGWNDNDEKRNHVADEETSVHDGRTMEESNDATRQSGEYEEVQGGGRKRDRRSRDEEREEEDRRSHRKARDEEKRSRSQRKKRGEKYDYSDDDDEESSEQEGRRRKKREKERRRKSKKRDRKRPRRGHRSSSSDESSSGDDEADGRRISTGGGISQKLVAKLQARGETLEERRQRRALRAEQKRAAYITTKFGYTAEDNPFHDPNLHQAFTWKKKQEVDRGRVGKKPDETTTGTLEEIEKLRQRRKQRELQLEEMDRIRREESRMKELENFDEWARKEEYFHLQQQRQRSAIRLVQGREKPIDVLAKNMLMFGVDQSNRAAVKYKERYNALDELNENIEVELDEPYKFLHLLKQHELEEALVEIDAFLTLEREAVEDKTEGVVDNNPILAYWLALKTVALDEIKFITSGGEQGQHAKTVAEVCKIFEQGQSTSELEQMKLQIQAKLKSNSERNNEHFGNSGSFDQDHWQTVLEQLEVYLAKKLLSEIHAQMLIRQLERLEEKRKQLSKRVPVDGQQKAAGVEVGSRDHQEHDSKPAKEEVEEGLGDLEEHELKEEAGMSSKTPKSYSWADKYRPRKPRYFNRVKTGYDWNKYNKTHYDRDNPPPKTVQGYKFNIFYPDLIDPSKTPQYQLLKADSDDFCLIRFTAGPPYEDVAFKIINREWNKSRKHGFKSTFERGILSLYFNFKTSWYRR